MNIKEVLVEDLMVNEELRVRGFIDLVVIDDEGRVFLYDIKSINAWSYRMKFGRNKESEGSIHQELQVATYGLELKKRFGRLDGMYLIYYNKDTSMIKQLEVDMSRLGSAQFYWDEVNEIHSKGMPPLKENESPIMDWECKYCNFAEECQEEG